MNVASLLAGKLIGAAVEGVADKFIKNLTPSQSPKFLDTLKQFNNQDRLNVEDLDLTPDEEISLMETVSNAQAKGIQNLEVNIKGKHYMINTQDFSCVPVV